jgi:hypothetical protein
MSTALCTGVSRHQAGEEVMVALTAFRLDSGAGHLAQYAIAVAKQLGLKVIADGGSGPPCDRV